MTSAWAAALAAATSYFALRSLPRVSRGPALRLLARAVPLSIALGWGAGLVTSDGFLGPSLAMMAGAAGVLVVVDVAEHRLPDTVMLAAFAVWWVGMIVKVASAGGRESIARAALGGAGVLLCFLVVALLAGGALGLGDVKLSGLMGLVLGWFGWYQLVTGVLVGLVLHGLSSVIVLVSTRNPKSEVPMGPALVAGAAVGLAFGPSIAAVYG